MNSCEIRKEFIKTYTKLTYRHHPWKVWKDFILMTACSVSNSVDKKYFTERENLYLRTIRGYSKEERFIFPELITLIVSALEINPEQDFLGDIFMELNLGNERNGQFFTPYSVCELMSSVSINNVVQQVKEDGYLTISDITCGAGATLIAGIHETRRQLEKENMNFQNHILATAQDIDYTAALMCYIQISLLGVAGYVKVGDTLTDPMKKSDSLENYWFTPMYFSKVWVYRRIFRGEML